MPELPPSSKYLQRAGDEIDDVERESLTERLTNAYVEGNLEQHEYMLDLDRVSNARTLGELVPVVERLPAPVEQLPKGTEVATNVAPGEVNQSRNLKVPALMVVGTMVMMMVVIGFILMSLF